MSPRLNVSIPEIPRIRLDIGCGGVDTTSSKPPYDSRPAGRSAYARVHKAGQINSSNINHLKIKKMEKFDFLTVDQMNSKVTELQANGSKEAEGIVTVPAGLLDGKPAVITVGTGKNAVKSPSCFVITYERKGESRFFKGAYFNAKHLSNGKSYENLTVGLKDEEIEDIKEPSNLLKSYSLRAEAYTTSDNRKVTTVKLDR